MKRLTRIMMVLLAVLMLSIPAMAAVETKQVNLRGVHTQVVTVDLNEEVKLAVAKGNDVLVGAQPFSAMINTHKPLAAINGNYFDAYKTLEPMASIIKGGHVIHMVGHTASMMVFDGHKVKIDNVTLKFNGYLDGKRENAWNQQTQSMDFNVFGIWYVNTKPTDTSGVYMYTAYRNVPLNLQGGHVVEVVGNKVGKTYVPAGKVTIPENGYIIYYGKDAATPDYVSARFKPGRSVELVLVNQDGSETFDYKGEKIPYSKVKEMVAAGPLVVQGGKNVAAVNKEMFKEAKINVNSAQRSAIGVTAEGKLVMVTAVTDVVTLGNILLDLGCVEGMNLDGGASSGLYANGSYLKSPGRHLNTILMVLKAEKPQPAPQPKQ